MLLLDQLATLNYDEVQISAGAFAASDSRLAVGSFSGWALFDLRTLGCLRSEPRLLPEGCDVKGVQFHGRDILLLGYRRSQNSDTPADWDAGIWLVEPDAGPTLLRDLPAGNWRLVKRRFGDQVALYDVTEGQGIYSWSRSGTTWNTAITDLRVAVPSPTGILCLCRERIVYLGLDGTIVDDLALPYAERYNWTVAHGARSGAILGGFNRESHDFALAIPSDEPGGRSHLFEHPLRSVFSDDTLARALDDECCGVDIFHIGRVESLGPTTFLLALGGGGEELGACQGAGAVAVVNIEDGRTVWETQVLDEFEGISGLLLLEDGRVLVDFCGDIRIYASPGLTRA